MEEKYINLLINRCLKLEKNGALFINYIKELKPFVEKLTLKVKEKGINDIYLKEIDSKEKHDILKKSTIEEIKNNPYFNNSVWDEYAKKNAAFLMIDSVIPHLYDDISEEKIALMQSISQMTKPIYRRKQLNNEISWCIAVMPNKMWAKDRFPYLSEKDAYNKLFELMMHATMVDKENPILEWNNFLENQKRIANKLNDLKIKKLHYKNSLGTDLEISLSEKAIWECAGYEENMIVNMPTYEIFTSPDKRYTNGIVYSTMPLTYNDYVIDNFWLKFENGKVIDYGASVGKEILKGIINGDDGAKFLGECALVSKNSAIAKLDFVFGETCLDENASCHLALGEGFKDCIDKGLEMSDESLDELGLNKSNNHVDFMIGTKDLDIWAETEQGLVQIFKDGEYNI